MRTRVVPRRRAVRGIALALALAPGASPWATASAREPVAADDDVLIGQRARHPLTATIGLPEAASRRFGAQALRVSFEHGSAFMGGTAPDGEALLLDGETSELAVRWRVPVGECRALDVRGALLAHADGAFDDPIQSWHETFGLPNAGREIAPENRLLFVHVGADGERAELSRSGAGPADARLAFAWAPGCGRSVAGDDASVVLRAGIDLPTGDESAWRGNGAVDVWADVQSPVWTLGREWPTRLAASFGVVLPGSGDVLPEPVDVAAYGAAGLRVPFGAGSPWTLSASLDWHTRLYDSALTELGDGAVQLGVGIERRLPGLGTAGFAILEDVLVDTSSDIVARFTLDLSR